MACQLAKPSNTRFQTLLTPLVFLLPLSVPASTSSPQTGLSSRYSRITRHAFSGAPHYLWDRTPRHRRSQEAQGHLPGIHHGLPRSPRRNSEGGKQLFLQHARICSYPMHQYPVWVKWLNDKIERWKPLSLIFVIS